MSGSASLPDKKAVLVQCHATSEQHLGVQIGPLLNVLADQLYELGQKSQDREEREHFLQAVTRLRNERSAFSDGFQKEYREHVQTCVRTLLGGAPGTTGLDGAALSMLKTNVLENQVAVGRLAVRLKEAAGTELMPLSARLATLFKRTALDDGDNPFGPLAIAHGIFAGIEALRLHSHAIRAVRPTIEQKLGEPVRELYRALNTTLGALGIAPAAPPPAKGPEKVIVAAPPAATAANTAAPRAPVSAEAAPPAAAQAAAAQAIAAHVAGKTLPPAVEAFLKETWLRVLARAYAAQGTAGAPWREAVGTMEALVWSLQPALQPADRTRLMGLLPTLLKRITAGMDAVDLQAQRRETVFDALMVHHRALLRSLGSSPQG